MARWFIAIAAVITAGAAAWLAATGFIARDRERPAVQALIGRTQLNIPGELIRDGSAHRTTGDFELAVTWPDLKPLALMRPGEAPGPRVFLGIRLAQQEPVLATSPSDLYGPFFEPETWTHPSGLIVRRFRDNSPYRGEDIYLSPPEGRAFFARCAKTGSTLDASAEHCLWMYGFGDVIVQVRFSPDQLGEWEQFKDAIQGLVARFSEMAK